MKANKLYTSIISTILLIPFRLPITILLVQLFSRIAQIGGVSLTDEILVWNTTIVKILYNAIFSTLIIYNVEMFSRKYYGRKASSSYTQEEPCYWWTVAIGIILAIFLIIDGFLVSDIYYAIK